MPGIINITRNLTRGLASLMGNVFARLFDNVLAWLWFSALLLVVALFILFAPIRAVGDGGRSLSGVIAIIGGMLLVAAGGGWAQCKLGEERTMRLGGLLVRLIVPAAIVGMALWLWLS